MGPGAAGILNYELREWREKGNSGWTGSVFL
jgi:hypothetical protein